MATRLDRLFLLLDTGTSPLTRKAAAQQLGEVQRLHPHELPLLLSKVSTYLRSPVWETRIAAAQAVEAILSHVPRWTCVPSVKKEEKNDRDLYAGRLRFDEFDISQILARRQYLMASEGKEFDDEFPVGMDARDRLVMQRQALNQRLGLDVAAKLGIQLGCEDLVEADDLDNTNKNSGIQSIKKASLEQALNNLSSREVNRAKRKARLVAKQKSRDVTTSSTSTSDTFDSGLGDCSPNPTAGDEMPSRKKLKSGSTSASSSRPSSPKNITHEGPLVVMEHVPDAMGTWGEAASWPLEQFCDLLIGDLFHPEWEVRHGAATALRELIKLHGTGMGKSSDMTLHEMEAAHQCCLEDVVLRVVCVLALDRFGDFVSDQVVAPVRETCAQTLGSVVQLMSGKGVEGLCGILTQLLQQHEWEARHGGFLSLKYLMAIRQDLQSSLLPAVYPSLYTGLQDSVDDVTAVAASALVPLASTLTDFLSQTQLGLLLGTLWDALLDLDDLTASTSSMLALLAALLAHPTAVEQESVNWADYIPRLWPFLTHASSAVRKSVLNTLLTLIQHKNGGYWLAPIAQDALRHVFQRILLEHAHDILTLVQNVWKATVTSLPLEVLLPTSCPFVASWLCLLMQPSRVPFDPNVLIFPPKAKDRSHRRNISQQELVSDGQTGVDVVNSNAMTVGDPRLYLAGGDVNYDTPQAREVGVARARIMGASMLGLLSQFLVKPMPGLEYTEDMEKPVDCYSKLLLVHLNSLSSTQRSVVALVIAEWAAQTEKVECPGNLLTRLHSSLSETVYYDEMGVAFTRVVHEAKDYIATLKHYKLPVDQVFPVGNFLSLEQILQLTSTVYDELTKATKVKPKILETLGERCKTLNSSAQQIVSDQSILNIWTLATLARAVILIGQLPDKLNPVIKPIMESIKLEENEQMQWLSAQCLSTLLERVQSRTPCPTPKIIKNLSSFVCADPDFAPKIESEKYTGIVTLLRSIEQAEKASASRKTGTGAHKKEKNGATSNESAEEGESSSKVLKIQRRGATMALQSLARFYGSQLPEKVPSFWEVITAQVAAIVPQKFDPGSLKEQDAAAEDLIASLQVWEVTCESLAPEPFTQLLNYVPTLCRLLEHPYRSIRHISARCLCAMAKIDTCAVLQAFLQTALPLLGAMELLYARQGAMEAIACLLEKLQMKIVPYIALLVVPVLGRMSDPDQNTRLVASQSFATLVRLMPLEGGVPDPPGLDESLVSKRAHDRKFLEQLFDPKNLDNFELPIPVNAQLRSYQQDGLNWLWFLNQYKLHGVLCDDMGLGKTLQSICILAADHYLRQQEFEKTGHKDCAPLLSIVVCPPTLTGHWVYEIEKFVSSEYLNPLHYTGSPTERTKLRSRFPHHNLIVASYDIVRNDIDFFSSFQWNYCILDEGHVIKNHKTKSSRAIKLIVANHRLILSGTPIQNNVLELWNLFDFLMPGFLGTEKQFNVRYSKPILASRDAKASSKEQEAGALAMEALHCQTLPFLLRRMKEDVLKDLPPKITQDYYCDLSPLQEQLYEDFAKTQAGQSVSASLQDSGTPQTHIFQALQYLRKVCNHPKLVLTHQHPQYGNITAQLASQKSNLNDIQHAAKLPALRQLLLDCGIGTQSGTQDLIVSPHRALIFCQLKSMLDILENDLFKAQMPAVTFLRLDGSVPAGQRHSVVTRFNDDPSIDVLLLTTQVGGLGLNLTGADTVIFLEHDWNPMKDVQAMDRAHRIGQKKVVNVYRLITRGTLEEKIMSLQKFKLQTANTVITSENANLQSMATDQLLDLFTLGEAKTKDYTVKGPDFSMSGMQGPYQAALQDLPELWSGEQYEQEYDLEAFLDTLKK